MNQTADNELWKKLEVCNHTELYQLCRAVGIPVLPSFSREEMARLLVGEAKPQYIDEADHPIDSWRHGLMNFILDHWTVLEPQLTCPAKTKDPRACFGCIAAQVITCVVQNPENEHLIQLHRPRRD